MFGPLVRRYGRSGERADLGSAVLGYEFMNEPDFVVEEWERDLSPHVPRPLPFEVLADLVSRLSELVHAEHPGALTTLGCARLHNLWAWDDASLGLDVLQLHSYPDVRHPERDADIFGTPASALGVRHGVILGEFPGNGPAQHPEGAAPPETTLGEYLEFAVNAGYAGAWPWSFSGTDAYGRLPEEPLRDFRGAAPGARESAETRDLTSIELLDRGDRRRALLLQARRDVFGAAHHAQHVQSRAPCGRRRPATRAAAAPP